MKTIPYVKDLQRHHKVAEATWESEHEMREKCHIFFATGILNFKDEVS